MASLNITIEFEDDAENTRTDEEISDIVLTKLNELPWHDEELTLLYVARN